MSNANRRHFVIRHDLESLQAMMHHIWRTRVGREEGPPHRYDQVRVGDRWVSFAYIDNERDGNKLSQIVRFSECVRARWYSSVPPEVLPICDGESEAWFIMGEPFGEQPATPTDVPSLPE